MPPISTTDLRAPSIGPRVDDRGLVILGIIALSLVGIFAQLDAIGKKLMGPSPVSLYELLLGLLLALAALLVIMPVRRRMLVTDPLAVRLIVVLACWMLVCLVFAQFRDLAFEYTIKAYAVMALPVLMGCFLRDARNVVPVLLGIIGAGLITALIIMYETRTGGRLFSTSVAAVQADFDGMIRSAGGSDLNPTSVAQMLMVSVLLSAALLMAGYRTLWPLLMVVILAGAVGIVMTSARSAVIGLGIGGILIMFRFYRSRYFPLVLLSGIALCAIGLMFLPATTLARFEAVANFSADRSLFRRMTYFRIGWDQLLRSPLWGVGPGNFPAYYMEAAYRFLPGRTLDPRELHNSYADAAVEYGLIGFGLFMAIIVTALSGVVLAARRAVEPLLRQISFAVMVALSALLASSFFMPHKDFRYLWLMIGLAMTCTALQRIEARNRMEVPS